jgi:hypothetical protein
MLGTPPQPSAGPVRPKDVLSKDDYTVYRLVRTVALLFLIYGVVFLLAGAFMAFGDPHFEETPAEKRARLQQGREREPMSPAIKGVIAGVCGAIGLSAIIGAGAVRSGSRRLIPFVYVPIVLYIFQFPVGTIIAGYLAWNLTRFREILDLLDAAAAPRDPKDPFAKPFPPGPVWGGPTR